MIDDERIELTNEYIVREGLAQRANRANFRLSLSRPPFWLREAKFLLILLLIAFLTMRGRFLQMLPVTLVFGLLGTVLIVWLQYRALRKHFDRLYPPGAILASGFGPLSLAFKDSVARNEIPFTSYSEVIQLDGFVFLKDRQGPSYLIMPEELAPPADLDRLRAAIGP